MTLRNGRTTKMILPNIVERVRYNIPRFIRKDIKKESIKVIGIDSEAYEDGKTFMFCTSENDIIKPEQIPQIFFNRKYRGCNFVVWNLKYEIGAIIQNLPIDNIKELRSESKTVYNDYTYKVIANKFLAILKGGHNVHFYDMAIFYLMSLDNAAKKYLNDSKIEMETKSFSHEYVTANWDRLAEYCIHDAVLTKRLADNIIKTFENLDVYPRKLFSVAYVSWQYFSRKCPYIHVKYYFDYQKEILNYAMHSYAGGKFEVTRKGTGYYYLYDIVSAYPYEISNLIDTRMMSCIKSKRYEKEAIYGYIHCRIDVPFEMYNPIPVKVHNVNFYTVGEMEKVITKKEYEYLISQGADITIINAWWLFRDKLEYPYRKEIKRLLKLKAKYKREGKKLEYNTVKKFLNSLYGKFQQMIPQGDILRAGAAWNPLYSSVITANCRIRMSEYQQKYKSVVAVHTDSIISTEKLDLELSTELGGMDFENEGEGIILGVGIYQVGEKSRFRGFNVGTPLLDLIPNKGKYLNITKQKAFSWREVAHRNMHIDNINKFELLNKKLKVDFDTKRMWEDDYTDYSQVTKRVVHSYPWDYQLLQMGR